MTCTELQTRAWDEWQDSPILQRQYPTFVYYWQERYVRVYRLDSRRLCEGLFTGLRRVAFPC